MTDHTCRQIRPTCPGCAEERRTWVPPVYTHRRVRVTVHKEVTYERVFETTDDALAERMFDEWMQSQPTEEDEHVSVREEWGDNDVEKCEEDDGNE